MKSRRSARRLQRDGIAEAIIDTLKGQLTLGDHGGRTLAGVYARVAARLLALAAASRVAGGNLTFRLPQIRA